MSEKKEKWAVVTGASKGIGKAIALSLSKEGYCISLASRKLNLLQEVAEACSRAGSPKTKVYAVDLSDSNQVDKLAKSLLDAPHKGVDILVNNAGMMLKDATALKGNPDDWEKMTQLNLLAPMRLTRRLSPAMVKKGGGLIINIGSIAAIEGMTHFPAYAATKHGLRGWSLSCYLSLRHHNIKVVLVNPAFVNTDLGNWIAGKEVIPERMLTPEDVAEAAMLAIRTSGACVPEEITLRLSLSAWKK